MAHVAQPGRNKNTSPQMITSSPGQDVRNSHDKDPKSLKQTPRGKGKGADPKFVSNQKNTNMASPKGSAGKG